MGFDFNKLCSDKFENLIMNKKSDYDTYFMGLDGKLTTENIKNY
jgi:cytochrome c peroxidase